MNPPWNLYFAWLNRANLALSHQTTTSPLIHWSLIFQNRFLNIKCLLCAPIYFAFLLLISISVSATLSKTNKTPEVVLVISLKSKHIHICDCCMKSTDQNFWRGRFFFPPVNSAKAGCCFLQHWCLYSHLPLSLVQVWFDERTFWDRSGVTDTHTPKLRQQQLDCIVGHPFL